MRRAQAALKPAQKEEKEAHGDWCVKLTAFDDFYLTRWEDFQQQPSEWLKEKEERLQNLEAGIKAWEKVRIE